MSGLTEGDKKLWRRIQDILWKDWDPIGVYESNAAWSDEYDSYAPYIFKLVIGGATQSEIANALTKIASETIGLTAELGNEHDFKVAELLVSAKELCND